MSNLEDRIKELITALATDYKGTRALIGNLNSLSTSEKSNLVAAINEVYTRAGSGGGGTSINDSAASTSTTYSSTKIVQLVGSIINDTTAGNGTTYSSTKINNAILALIDDASTTTTKTWSANKIQTAINAAVANLVGTAPAALDTIQELAAALGDANAINAINAALGNRVRADAAQTFTPAQKTQARQNIDAMGSVELGNPDADLVAFYNAAKV